MDVRVQTPDILPTGNFLHRSGMQASRYDIFDIPPSTQLPVEPIISHMCEMDLPYGDVVKCLDQHARLNKKVGRHMVQGCGRIDISVRRMSTPVPI